jgi:hypothetical protein
MDGFFRPVPKFNQTKPPKKLTEDFYLIKIKRFETFAVILSVEQASQVQTNERT